MNSRPATEPARFLTNQLLISMPHLVDSTFSQTVILVCKHDDNGALGIVVNQLTEHRMGEIFAELSVPVKNLSWSEQPVFCGGPVSPEMGLVIHDVALAQTWQSTIAIGPNLSLTSSKDILIALASGTGPTQALLSLGYAGWMPGQLEHELSQNAWFSAPADHGIIFDLETAQKWQRAAMLLGIDTAKMSRQVGHA